MGFDKDFLWGAASAAYQIEGAYDEDIALMKQMCLKSYRFSVSWPRIMSEEGFPIIGYQYPGKWGESLNHRIRIKIKSKRNERRRAV